MTGSCYEPPPLDHHNLMDSQSHRHSGVAASHPYGYAAAYNIPGHVGEGSMETAGNMSMYQQTLWQNSHHALLDDKRGSVIMGQPPPPAPPAKRKGGRKPKDDPVS